MRGAGEGRGEGIDDEVLDAFAGVGEQGSMAAVCRGGDGDCVDRLSFYTQGGEGGPEFWEPIIADLSTT